MKSVGGKEGWKILLVVLYFWGWVVISPTTCGIRKYMLIFFLLNELFYHPQE